MIDPQTAYTAFIEQRVGFFAGVPDSLLADICGYIADHAPARSHVITANEGTAIALAAGYHLATGGLPLVYMQNSGIGNAVNPLLSLVDPQVYRIPMLLLIGWRGEPGVHDEPQHVAQGAATVALCEAVRMPHLIMADTDAAAVAQIEAATRAARQRSGPQAILVRHGSFIPYACRSRVTNAAPLSREQALGLVVSALEDSAVTVCTTGRLSRELFEYREACGEGHEKDFLTVGSMGHASSIALGIALNQPNRIVYCLDGDGALLMHMGALATIGGLAPANYRHVVFNNGAHESVGAQPTAAGQLDIPAIAAACGYATVLRAETRAELDEALRAIRGAPGPALIEVRVGIRTRSDLGRPSRSPADNSRDFTTHLGRQP